MNQGPKLKRFLETARKVQEYVAYTFRIKIEDLLGRSRKRSFSYPRMLAMYIVRCTTGLSYPQIARQFGGLDHTSVIHACKWAKEASQYDEYAKAVINKFKQTTA